LWVHYKSSTVVLSAYDLLFEIVNGYSTYDEQVLYRGDFLDLREANYQYALEYVEQYFTDLIQARNEQFAKYILNVITLFLDKESAFFSRLSEIAKNSIISNEIEEILFEWSHHTKVTIVDEIIQAHHNKEKAILDEKEYLKIVSANLTKLSNDTGCVEQFKVTQKLLDKLFNLKIINTVQYQQTIQNSACNRWF